MHSSSLATPFGTLPFGCAVAAFALHMLSGTALAAEPAVQLVDPLNSGNWSWTQTEILGNPERIEFDDRVIVIAPDAAEDSFNVPVLVDATALDGVEQIVMFVDYGPIPKILTYWPGKAQAKVSFRFKIDQATPVRAAVKLDDGSWHIGSRAIDAGGGGCTAPAAAYASDDWEERLGEVRGMLWPDKGRLRMVISHPMDTGLADGIPAFFIEDVEIQASDGEQLARLELHEPVNEDPAFTLYFDKGQLDKEVTLKARDNNGNRIAADLRSRLSQ
jgi:sulfur-oxidizing protein SoxY